MSDLLASLPLYKGISPRAQADLTSALTALRYRRGERIFTVNDQAMHMYIIVTGKVKLVRPSKLSAPDPLPDPDPVVAQLPAVAREPRESLLWLLGPGDIFGELSMFDGGRRATSAVALLESTVVRVARDDLLNLMARHVDLTHTVMQMLAIRLRRANDTIAGLALSDVGGRLAHVLLSLGERWGVVNETGAIVVRHDLTQSELAQMVGASRETVNKVLTDFTNRGWIQLQQRRITICAPDKLAARIS